MQRRACVELSDTLMKKLLLLCLALSNSLSAQIFQANGTISTGWGAITAGSSFTFRFSLDAAVPDTGRLPNWGFYEGAAKQVVFSCGEGAYIGRVDALNVLILQTPDYDIFSIRTPAAGTIDFPAQDGQEFLDTVGNSVLQFSDRTKSALRSTALTDFDADTFASLLEDSAVRNFSLPFRDLGTGIFPVTGRIEGVEVFPEAAAVPEAATYGWWGGAALVLAVALRTWRRGR